MSTRNRPPSLGRRLLPALAMTTAASGLVALLDRPSSGAAVDLGTDGASEPATQPVATSGAAPTAASTQPPAVSSTLPTAASPAATQGTPATTATTTPAASATCTGQTIDGPTMDTRWGPVQVEAVVSNDGQICDVDAIQYPTSHRRSQQINNRALPILHTQVMQAQSVNINGVSGATITSIGYVRSLQAILDQVG